jgi:hypothetical protein
MGTHLHLHLPELASAATWEMGQLIFRNILKMWHFMLRWKTCGTYSYVGWSYGGSDQQSTTMLHLFFARYLNHGK